MDGLQSTIEKSQDREFQQEPGGRNWNTGSEKHSLLACSPWLDQVPFLHNPEPAAKSGTIRSGLGPSTSIIDQEYLQAYQIDVILQLRVPLSRWL